MSVCLSVCLSVWLSFCMSIQTTTHEPLLLRPSFSVLTHLCNIQVIWSRLNKTVTFYTILLLHGCISQKLAQDVKVLVTNCSLSVNRFPQRTYLNLILSELTWKCYPWKTSFLWSNIAFTRLTGWFTETKKVLSLELNRQTDRHTPNRIKSICKSSS